MNPEVLIDAFTLDDRGIYTTQSVHWDTLYRHPHAHRAWCVGCRLSRLKDVGVCRPMSPATQTQTDTTPSQVQIAPTANRHNNKTKK